MLSLESAESNTKYNIASNIYGKLFFAGVSIRRESFHPEVYKRAAYNTMAHKLINMPLNRHNFQEEVPITIKKVK